MLPIFVNQAMRYLVLMINQHSLAINSFIIIKEQLLFNVFPVLYYIRDLKIEETKLGSFLGEYDLSVRQYFPQISVEIENA